MTTASLGFFILIGGVFFEIDGSVALYLAQLRFEHGKSLYHPFARDLRF